MADEVIESADSSNGEELDLTPDSTGEDVETLRQRLADTEAKNKQLYARLKKGKVEPTIQEEVGDTGTRLSRLEETEAKRQFGYENSLSPDETDKVFSYNKSPTKDTLQDPFIKAGIDAMRKLKRVSDATPSPSGRSSMVAGKPLSEVIKDPAERAKNFDEIRKAIIGK